MRRSAVMENSKMRFPWFGAGLIVVGSAMLLHRMGVVTFGWHAAFWGVVALAGLYKVVTAFTTGRAGAAFWGTVFLVVGGYQTLEYLGVVYVSSYLLFPWTVVLVGAGFLMMFAVRPRDWHVLVPAAFFVGTGTVMVLAEMGYFDRWDVMDALRQYWPIALILFGITLLLNRRSSA
jgi:hypothetical protein